MIRLPETFSTHDLESILDSPDEEIYLDVVPIYSYPPGQLSRLLQVLFTKIRNAKHLTITFGMDERDENYIFEHFYSYYQILTIILFVKNLPNVLLQNKKGFSINKEKLSSVSITKLDLQEQLYASTFEFIDGLDSSKTKLNELKHVLFSDRGTRKEQDGLIFLIPNFDHIPALRLTSYFYNNQALLRSKTEIISWVTKAFRYNKLNIREGVYRNQTHNDMAIVLKELFDNTEEWARSNFNETEEYNPNIRCCYLNILMERRVESFTIRTQEPVIDYVTTLMNSTPEQLRIPNWQSELYSNSKVGLCEISILDSGPGMARRWLGKDYSEMSIQDEVTAVNNCFNKYVTSDRTGKHSVRGRGLNNVIRVIGNSGFLIVRTGHVYLYRDFFEEKLSKYELAGYELSLKTENRSLTEGTSITILYPFLYNS